MNNKNKDFFINGVENNVSEEEIVLAQPTELYDEAREIAQNTNADEKFPFTLQYDANQKEFLLSMLSEAGAIVEGDDEENHILSTMMNMTQLAFIKRLDCVEKAKTNKGINPFLAKEAEPLHPIQTDLPESDDLLDDGQAERIVAVNDATLEVASELAPSEVESQADYGIAVATVTGSSRSASDSSSMETAATVSDESFTRGCIGCSGAEQWFKFTATESAKYTICTTGDLDTIGTLYDCNGDMIEEVDDYAPCGNTNFRIIRNLSAGETYYVRVRLYNNDTGSYNLKVTRMVLANYVSINKSTITLEKDVLYELPITPNYTYKGYNGAQRIPGLSVSINPSNADEQKIWWWEQAGSVLECYCDWDDDGDRYIHVTATGTGTAKLYAQDWNENGKRDECAVSVVTEGWLECQKPTINSRESWGARNKVENRLVERTNSPQLIIFHHTADKFQSTDTTKIIAEIKETQDEHIDDKGKCDIAYHFIIDPAGGIWQGAEIDEYQRGHAEGHFNDIGVVLLGDFEKRLLNPNPNTLNDNQKNAMKELSKWLCYKYDLPFDRINRVPPITTHKSASGGTECPGDNAESWIENDLKKYIENWHP